MTIQLNWRKSVVNKEKEVLAHGHEETGHILDTIDTLPVQKCLSGHEEIVGTYINHFDKEVIGANACFPERGWTLLAEINTDEAFASVRSTTYGLVIMLFFVLLFVILDIYLISGKIVKPIKKLHEASDIIAQGNLDYRVDIKTKDEVQQLAEAFNEMAANLKKSHSELQQYSKGLENMVAEKTRDLQAKVDDLNQTREAILNVAEDTEEEKQRTAREKDKIDAILHSIGDGVFVVDKNLIITMYNQVAADISGFNIEEAVGKKYDRVLNFIFENDGKTNNRFIKEAMATGEIKEMANHTVLIRKDGSKIAVADSAAPLKERNGEVIGCVVVFRDVTKERSIDKAKTEFVSLASHQLRTPLSSINWYTEMLLAGDAGKINTEQKKYLDEVYKGNKRMVDLVNSLLNVSRLELGTFVVEPEPTDVAKVAQSVAEEQKPQIQEKKIKFSEKYTNNLPKLNADPKLLRMVFQNLLSNAIKYTPDKGIINVDVHLVKCGESLDSQKAKEDSIAIIVSDTGYGITKSQQDKIFTKLFRADNIREKDTEGTGLGLYIIKSIINHSGGKIWFESRENKGTTFYVILPLSGMKKKEGAKALA